MKTPSDSSQPPEEPAVLLLDQTFSSQKLAAILAAAPEWKVELHGAHFNGDAKDHEWVPVAASRGWLILSCDKRIRKWRTENGLARKAAMDNAAKVFFLARGSRPLVEYGYIVGQARKSILRLAKKNRGGPLFARILSNGTVEPLFMDNLTKRDKTRQKFGNVING